MLECDKQINQILNKKCFGFGKNLSKKELCLLKTFETLNKIGQILIVVVVILITILLLNNTHFDTQHTILSFQNFISNSELIDEALFGAQASFECKHFVLELDKQLSL